MRRILRWLGLALLVLVATGYAAYRQWLGPDPLELLASIEVPPAPPLSPEEELATFRVAPGFRVELVAAEPLVVDPVAVDWDDEGRLYALEMRGYMPDVHGTGEDAPVGRVVVLEDSDADGRMDRQRVFLDGLVLPRALAVLPEGVLVGTPGDLWLCRDEDADLACDEKLRVGDYAFRGTNPEHMENGLLAGLDGWLYNAASSRRLRLLDADPPRVQAEEVARRGQWGIAQDDDGRLYYNHNSGFLYVDTIPAGYVTRQPLTAGTRPAAGLNLDLAVDEQVAGIRVAPGLNRAYLRGTLRRDGRQSGPTGASGVEIQRGHQYGPEFAGDAFVPESAGSVVAHLSIEHDGLTASGEHVTYPDDTWGEREFLASTHERFRPVDVEVGPDGALWVVDMYRGLIQHAKYVSPHLHEYAKEHGLEAPGATGRIWRIVREDRPIERRPPPLATTQQQLAGLSHPNGWVRDRAQRRLAHERRPETVAALRHLEGFEGVSRRHALWALHAMGKLDPPTWKRALGDADPVVRSVAIRLGESFYGDADVDVVARVRPLLDDPDPRVRVQALHTLGAAPLEVRPLEVLLAAGRDGDAFATQAAISGLAGLEFEALEREVARAGSGSLDEGAGRWLAAIGGAAHLAARQAPAPTPATARVLDFVAALESGPAAAAVLSGIADAQRLPGSRLVELDRMPAIFEPDRPSDDGVAVALRRARPHFTWPGDPNPGGARRLTPEESARREAGRELFASVCAACHGEGGRGIAGLAPSLVGSTWVRDSDEWLVRIVLNGLTGPLLIDGEPWNLTMPPHGGDPAFDDEAVAGLLTHLRRSWGHAEEPVAPETVARIRARTADRRLPWTVEELKRLPIEHRLDRYVGIYRVPLVGMELEVKNDESQLWFGMVDGPYNPMEEMGSGFFTSPELSMQFEIDESGAVTGASATREGTTFPLSREG